MSDKPTTPPGVNQWMEDELFVRYKHDRETVDRSWSDLFDADGGEPASKAKSDEPPAEPKPPAQPKQAAASVQPARIAAPQAPATPIDPTDQLVPLKGAAARIAENMTASLTLPVATSQRTIPVKVMEENRRILNQHLVLVGKAKVSFTHLIGFALVQAVRKHPTLNHAYAEQEEGAFRVVRDKVNLGIAIDVPGKDGAPSLLVPSIKDAGSMNFHQFLDAYGDIVARGRKGRLTVDDFQGTTISLTNPGTVGTVGSVPRLMPGQGAIVATGAIDFPAEYKGASPETLATVGISKVMTLTCTYDHRVIQGAESGRFLGAIEALLRGEDGFYEWIFSDLKMPHYPVRWEPDRRATTTVAGGETQAVAKESAVLQLINAYRVRGHLIADLDPLGTEPSYHPELDPATYGLTIWDLDRVFHTGTLGQGIGEGSVARMATLREILETLRQTYCGKIGCEYMNIQHPEQKRWLQERMEPQANNWALSEKDRMEILERLLEAEQFEHFLAARFVGHKRFSLEGAEAAIAILDELLDRAADSGVVEAVIGMAHRGRLNVLANVVGKPLKQIFAEFEGDVDPMSTQGSGDVKYHLGATGTHTAPSGVEIAVSVSPNPSHLEAVDPVVEGIVKPKQERLNDAERTKVIPILIHGDAAFAGQGVVAETLNFSQLEGYHTGGTIHIIINNQIGFTTAPEEARSSPYSTDVAKAVQAPVFHVNGDDSEAVVRVVQIAFDYRQRFNKDVVVDMFCYRRHGHNEGDDPSFTQPLLYRKIHEHSSVAEIYTAKCIRDGLITADRAAEMRADFKSRFQQGYEAAQAEEAQYEVQEIGNFDTFETPDFCPHTAVSSELLRSIVDGLARFPENFELHPKLKSFVERRQKMLDTGKVDWALGEALAFGSLVTEGTPVRLSGQDSERGTFSQRHLGFYDYHNGVRHVPMQYLSDNQARFEVHDSSLSEYAVVGFEFGYSLGDPLTLVLWEAQFGDFANGAQIMIDQFITCAEMKWGQPSGLVMLLPHGFEGQGPEHSSARIERFLILTAESNIQIANCTTPAQYFHLLRRQMYGGEDRRGIRKPLIVFTPKSLLRHADCVSAIEEFSEDGFHEVLPDNLIPPDRAGRILFCSGKVYYELLKERANRKANNVAIVRMEQLYPFPASQVQQILAACAPTAEVVWVQEEPINMGPWRFIREKVNPLLDPTERAIRYVGRAESASPATGSHKRHLEEQAEILEGAFAEGELVHRRRIRVR